MQNIHIISVGKPVKDLLSHTKEYQKMIRTKVNITEITYSQKLPAGQVKQFEGRKISEHLSKDSFKIVLDVKGKELSSHEFSNLIVRDRKIDFIIGGAYGLDQTVLDIADFRLSLSRMTFPHQIAKLLLLEQIYRAQTILENHPYHK